jgi:hypothetical protein
MLWIEKTFLPSLGLLNPFVILATDSIIKENYGESKVFLFELIDNDSILNVV